MADSGNSADRSTREVPGNVGQGSGTAPPEVPVTDLPAAVQTGGEGSSTAASGSGPSEPAPPPPPPPPPAAAQAAGGGPYVCHLCNPPTAFDNDRAMAGHMRRHRDRAWRGSFPPPVFSRQEFMGDDIARGLLNAPIQEQEAALAAERGFVHHFDLNVGVPGADEPAPAGPSGSDIPANGLSEDDTV
ncbi:uncharacterized protein LOC127804331 [Diospyros lotus]|uniref:uncharacterized protein LOC127804331 n=1 Tax=Diospyros lotus TaxID=55363 RepID=UPI0022516309|nr:uncharacterized protein LOC127804331 [Diospyros lotus]